MRLKWQRRGLGCVVLAVASLWAQGQERAGVSPSPPQVGARAHADPHPIGSAKSAAEVFQKGVGLVEKEQYSAALPWLRRAAALAPRDGRVHHYLGYALWKTRRSKAAKEEFETALRLEPRNPYTQYFLARIAYSQGEVKAAIQLYEALASAGNAVYDTYQRLGQSYLRQGYLSKALEAAQQALQQAPWDGAIHYQLGRIYQRMGRLEEARKEFESGERSKRADQISIQKLLELSQAVRDQRTERVLELRADLLSQPSRDPEILVWLGTLLGQGGLYQEAAEPLHRAVEMAPDSFEAQCNLGLTLARLEKYREAETTLRKCLALQPSSFEANSVLAVLYVGERRNQEAIERLRAANRARPDNAKVLALLGEQYLVGRYFDEAVQVLKEAVRRKPDDPNLRYLLIEAYHRNQQNDSALKAAQEALRADPSEARSHFEVGRQLTHLGRYQEARPYFEQTVRVDATFGEGHVGLGDLHLRAGEYQAALEGFERARALDPKNLAALRGIGQSLMRLRRYEQAQSEIEGGITAHPDDAELYFQLSQVSARLGNSSRAKEAAATFQRLRAQEIEKQEVLERKRRFPSEPYRRTSQP